MALTTQPSLTQVHMLRSSERVAVELTSNAHMMRIVRGMGRFFDTWLFVDRSSHEQTARAKRRACLCGLIRGSGAVWVAPTDFRDCPG